MRDRFLDDGEPLKRAAFEIAQGATLGDERPTSPPSHSDCPCRAVGVAWRARFSSPSYPGLHPGLFQIPPLRG